MKGNNGIFRSSRVYGGRVAYFKTPKMRGRVSIFSSGKMISVGTRSERNALRELKMAMMFLVEKIFAKPIDLNAKTQNIVATANFEISINLEKLAETSKTIYEPERFPGAILRLQEPHRANILILASGKTVITDLRNSTDIKPLVMRLKELIG